MNPQDEVISDVFNRDVMANGGYRYTTNAGLSSELANRRLNDAIFTATSLKGKRVLDLGCGDGTATIRIFDEAQPERMTGIDAAGEAIHLAQRSAGERRINFLTQSAYQLEFAANAFDVALLRGVLHHMDHPEDALREAFRVAPCAVILEPNGYNPVLKLIERFSSYHVEHGEKSYPPYRLDRWTRELGDSVTYRRFVGLVPMFCPDWAARVLKKIEPIVENFPLFNKIACGVYVFVAQRPH